MPEAKPTRWGLALGGIAGGLAATAMLVLFFRVIAFQSGFLLNPKWQSAKLIRVWTEIEPLPLAVTSPWTITLGFVGLGLLHALAFAYVGPLLGETLWQQARRFAALIWLFSYLFFEFFTPYNMFHEPVWLVLVQLVLWMPVALAEGLVIAAIARWSAARAA